MNPFGYSAMLLASVSSNIWAKCIEGESWESLAIVTFLASWPPKLLMLFDLMPKERRL